MEAFFLGAVVLRALLLAQGFEDRADGCRAPGGEVAADHRGASERGAGLDKAVLEGVVRVVGVGPLLAPLLDRAGRDRRQVVQGRSG
jgi:hypothetical protein